MSDARELVLRIRGKLMYAKTETVAAEIERFAQARAEAAEAKAVQYSEELGVALADVVHYEADLAALKASGDEYHTMDEMYAHRFALTRALVVLMPEKCVKSKRNGDGSVWDGLFVVYIDTPAGQVSYHYRLELWDQMPCKEVETPPAYDGHTPEITLARLASIVPSAEPGALRDLLLEVLELREKYWGNADMASNLAGWALRARAALGKEGS